MKFGVKDLPYEIMADGSIEIKTPPTRNHR